MLFKRRLLKEEEVSFELQVIRRTVFRLERGGANVLGKIRPKDKHCHDLSLLLPYLLFSSKLYLLRIGQTNFEQCYCKKSTFQTRNPSFARTNSKMQQKLITPAKSNLDLARLTRFFSFQQKTVKQKVKQEEL